MGDDEVVDVEVLRARRRARGMVSLGSPDQPVDLTPAAPPVGRPDAARVWAVVNRVAMSQVEALCGRVVWRVCRSDLAALAEYAGVQLTQGVQPTLFGVPVEVVEDAPGRFPELVLVVDRRVRG